MVQPTQPMKIGWFFYREIQGRGKINKFICLLINVEKCGNNYNTYAKQIRHIRAFARIKYYRQAL
jgi:hypothetical protein